MVTSEPVSCTAPHDAYDNCGREQEVQPLVAINRCLLG